MAKSDTVKDLGIRVKPQGGTAAIVHRPAVDEPRLGYAPTVALAPQSPIACNLNFEPVGERVDDRDPDAVQSA